MSEAESKIDFDLAQQKTDLEAKAAAAKAKLGIKIFAQESRTMVDVSPNILPEKKTKKTSEVGFEALGKETMENERLDSEQKKLEAVERDVEARQEARYEKDHDLGLVKDKERWAKDYRGVRDEFAGKRDGEGGRVGEKEGVYQMGDSEYKVLKFRNNDAREEAGAEGADRGGGDGGARKTAVSEQDGGARKAAISEHNLDDMIGSMVREKFRNGGLLTKD